MKKFALTAVAVAMFSGVASAETIKIPDGYRADTAANGIITIMKKGEDGKYHAFEYHTVKEDMVLEHSDGYQVNVKSAGENYDTYKEHTDKWNAENKGHAAGDGTANDGMNHKPLPGFGNGEAGGLDPEFGQGEAGRPDRPFPGTGLPERPLPGQGETPERPFPGAGEGSVERPRPGQEQERPKPVVPGGILQQTEANKNNIAAMGEAFEQRVDVVNDYLSQAGQAIQNNSNKVDALAGAFQAQAAHTTQEIARLDGRIDALEEKTDKLKGGIASATAIASLTQYVGHGQHHVAVGIGGYDGAAAMAAGYTYAISADTTVRATFAFDTEGDVAMGASIGHSW